MACIKDGWFYEKSDSFPGQTFGLEIEKIFFQGKSSFQEILVFESKTYGIVLVLDGIIQCTSRDELSYQEMISFIPLNCHPNPKKVLIIGGGDGGVAREVAKHPSVDKIDLCEIDEMVIDVSRKFIPEMASGFSNEKLTLHISDGFKFLEQQSVQYDVIIADISDPDGPAERLFGEKFYALMKSALKEDGLLCVQGESFWIDLPLIKEILTFSRKLFPVVSYAHSSVPTYTSGVIGFVLCSKNPATNFKAPLNVFSDEEKGRLDIRYYDEKLHESAFVFPAYVRKELNL